MQFLSSLFVQEPLHILAVACLLLACYLALRGRQRRGEHRTGVLLSASIAWVGYAGWEWLVLRRTPDADIRVDLLLIWPLLAVLSIWGLVRAAR